jgi:hypothetical protein
MNCCGKSNSIVPDKLPSKGKWRAMLSLLSLEEWQTVGIIASIILGMVTLIVSVTIAVYQMRLQIRQIRSSTAINIALQLDQLNLSALDHPEIYDQLGKPYLQRPGKGRDRAALLMDIRLNLFDQIYTQHKKYTLIEKDDFEVWIRVIKDMFQTEPYALGYWKTTKHVYDPHFVALVDKMLDSL